MKLRVLRFNGTKIFTELWEKHDCTHENIQIIKPKIKEIIKRWE